MRTSSIPAPVLMIMAVLSVQFGAALARTQFDAVGPIVGDEVLGAGFHVQIEQRVGVPVLGLPAVLDFHEADLGRMAVVLDVVVVLPVALDVHAARVPVAHLRHALRTPMRPDTELRIAEPIGRAVAVDQRIPGWREGRRKRRCFRPPQGKRRGRGRGRGLQK